MTTTAIVASDGRDSDVRLQIPTDGHDSHGRSIGGRAAVSSSRGVGLIQFGYLTDRLT